MAASADVWGRSRRAAVFVASAMLMISACSNSGGGESDAAAPETQAPVAEAAPETVVVETAAPDPAAPETAAPDTVAPQAAAAPELGEFAPISGVPGVTDEAITFAVLGTGPSNPLGYCLLECYNAGVQSYFDYRNSVGGVHGRELKIGRVDDDEVGNTQVKILEIIEDDSVFGLFASPLQYSGFADLAASGMPVFTTFPAAGDVNGHENMYLPVGTNCINCPRKLNIATAKAAGATKVASLGFGISQASKDCVANSVEAFATWGPAAGVELVYSNDTLQFGLPNGLGPEVTAMKDAGVNGILLCVDQNSALSLEQELERQGIGDQVVVVLPQGYGDTEFLANNAELLEGDLLPLSYRPFETDISGTETAIMLEWLSKSDALINDYNIQGWMGARQAVTGILAAGPQFDRASAIAGLNSITDYTGGGLTPPVDWTRQHSAPTREDPVSNAPKFDCVVYLVVRSGKVELLRDAAKPFTCLESGIPEWVEPTQMNFE